MHYSRTFIKLMILLSDIAPAAWITLLASRRSDVRTDVVFVFSPSVPDPTRVNKDSYLSSEFGLVEYIFQSVAVLRSLGNRNVRSALSHQKKNFQGVVGGVKLIIEIFCPNCRNQSVRDWSIYYISDITGPKL